MYMSEFDLKENHGIKRTHFVGKMFGKVLVRDSFSLLLVITVDTSVSRSASPLPHQRSLLSACKGEISKDVKCDEIFNKLYAVCESNGCKSFTLLFCDTL